MLAKRIIPCLDVKEGRVVKGTSFVNLRDAGDPVEQAKIYNEQGADELVFLDITASYEKRKIIWEVVRKVAECIFIPFTVGGGIKTLQDARNILKLGADKISINTAAVKNPKLITQIANKFGSQCVVVAIDAKRRQNSEKNNYELRITNYELNKKQKTRNIKQNNKLSTMNYKRTAEIALASPRNDGYKSNSQLSTHNSQLISWEVYINGGRTPTGLDAVQWAKEAQQLGAGEILLTSMDKDGQQTGYDLELLKTISENVSIPVIASGGAGNLKHLKDALTKGCADAVLAASIFHYQKYTVKNVKKYLQKNNITVRF